jgi:multiple sugar transport system ATP-binding protein
VIEELGADAYVFCLAELGGTETKLVARVDARQVPARGERVTLRPAAEDVHVFDAESGERLGS